MLADLHRHLDGSLRVDTLRALAGSVPEDLRFFAGMGLQAALARFAFTVGALRTPHAVRRVAAEICEDAAAEGVSTLEIRFAPQLHGGSAEAIVDAALEGVDGRVGLILCGLYGEDPAVLEGHVAMARTRPGVVGIDLAGGPLATHPWRLTDYAPAYRRAADLGLGRTVHAGEGRPPSEIREAIERLGAQRIGHGTTLLDDLSVVDLVLREAVTIEACPTSNVHTGVIAQLTDHPLPRWLAAGVRACVCTDNTLLSDVTSPEEHRRVASLPGMSEALLARTIAHGHAAAFPTR